ncbi:MAG: YicC/YloC family endoribonuclease [Fibrobacterota bacterium]
MAIESMTGFGSCEQERNTGAYKIEVKSVNHRYMNVQFNAPRLFNNLELKVRSHISERLKRGAVSVFVHHETPAATKNITCDTVLTGKYVAALQEIKDRFHLEGGVDIAHLSPFFRDILQDDVFAADDTELWEDLRCVLDAALDSLLEDRRREGKYLVAQLKKNMDEIDAGLGKIKTRVPHRSREYKEKMSAMFSELEKEGLDEERYYTEVALMASKLDISEELTRLDSHRESMNDLLESTQEIGKKINFLLQEMNREVNTIGSKANDAVIAQVVVDLKEQVEIIREQSLNIV